MGEIWGVGGRLVFGSGTTEVSLLSHHPLLTVDSLGISDELKDKLEDVLIPEQQFTLGRMLGKGMWDYRGCHEWSLLYLGVFD